MVDKRKNKQKWIWWGVGVAVVIIIAVIVGVVIWQNNKGGGDAAGGEDTAEVKEKKEKSDDVAEDDKFAEEEIEKKKVTQYEGEDPNAAEELTGVVTYAGVVDGMLTVRVSIDQYVMDGVCELALNRGGAAIYNSVARVMGDATTATCEGFDVPVSEVGSGNTEIVINVSAEGRSGVIRGEVDL